MAWYEKGKLPEWRALVDRPYTSNALLASKDLLLQELPRVTELQVFLRQHRDEIVGDLLVLCLQPASEDSCYQRKYAHPTRAIDLITNEFFFSSLGLDAHALRALVERALEHFLKVDPHMDNVNLYHAYFERLLRGLIGCRAIDKLDLATAIQELQREGGFVERLFLHSHKLAVCSALEMMLTLDLMEPFVTLQLEFKQSIIGQIFNTLASHAESLADPERTENCLQVLKTFFERSINFIVARRSEPETPLTKVKMDILFTTYSLFQANFAPLPRIVTSGTENGIKVAVFEVLQLNQIFLNQPETRLRQFSPEWGLDQTQTLISFMLGSRVGLAHPAFVDWLTISFAQVGQRGGKVELLRRMGVLEGVVGLLLAHRGNNILAAKIQQFLKVVFHNVAEGEVIGCIERSKLTPNAASPFTLLHYALQSMAPLEAAVRQFKSINDPLFVTLFTLFKIITQYCRNIDSLLSLYGQVEGTVAARAAVGAAIDFQSKQQCFQVFEREAAKDLGRFYSDEMFADQQPLEFTVRPLPAPFLLATNTPIEAIRPQTIITMPAAPLEPLSGILEKEETGGQTEQSTPASAPSESSVVFSSIVSQQNQEEGGTQPISSKYGSFVRQKLREVESNIPMRRSKSRTPTKIKNQLKKAKNKWVTTADGDGQPNDTSDINASQRSLSEQKPPRIIVTEGKVEKIMLLRVGKIRLKPDKARLIDAERDKRLLRLLAGLNA